MSDLFTIEEEEPKSQTTLWIIAGGLALLMLVLNLWPGEKKKKRTAASAVVATIAATTPIPPQAARKVSWPRFSFDQVTAVNPFQMNKNLEDALEVVEVPEAEPEPAVTVASEPILLDEKKYPVSFVFHGPRGAAALIAGVVYYEGDLLDGVEIVRIAQDGVIVRPVTAVSESGSNANSGG